jgi:site-specific recombinase XerD
LGELTGSEVSAFLQHTEQERHDSIGTRNCRLAALRSFFSFVAGREPTIVEQCTEILRIPTKRAPIHAPCYLDSSEVEAILAQPDRSTFEGQRDHTMLSFLYNSGARIQEALNVCPQAIRFDTPACVRLYGKGRKERLCPLWPETVTLIKSLLQRRPRRDDEPIFVNRYGVPLGASGVRFKLVKYVNEAAKIVPSLTSKHVTPHSFRYVASFIMF